jgi:CDP-glycerol glycerophosphotransferase
VPNPDVSVVVIVYNDADRLPTAVRSVTAQTLRNLEVVIVDDCSTDNTAEVAAQLCAEDPRVRYLRLPQNSGGCSAPRNAGIDATSAPWLMFLDSDDVYDRHACKNLLLAVERSGAELGVGRCARVIAATGRRSEWYWHLSENRATYESVLEHPDLLWDTISVNKIYARSFLDREQLRFPTGVHYEDQVFTARAYVLARGITVIPNIVYSWMVYDDGRPSITNRRRELTNLEHRLEVNRQIDAFLDSHSHGDELRTRKAVKFLRHDLRLYLNDLLLHEQDYQQALLDLVAPYLLTVPEEAYEQCSQVENLVYYLLRRKDLGGLLSAVDYMQNNGRMSTVLHEVDGRVYWNDRHLDDPEGRRILDVTELSIHRIPFAQRALSHTAETISIRGSVLHLTGSTLLQTSDLTDDEPITGALSVRRGGTRVHKDFPLVSCERKGAGLVWEVRADLNQLPWPRQRTQSWHAELRITKGERQNLSQVRIGEVAPTPVAVRPPLRLLLGDSLIPTRNRRGNLVLKLAQSHAVPRRVGDGVATVARTQSFKNGLKRLTDLRRGTAIKSWLYANVLTRFPIEPGLVVFESQMGKQYSDSPKAVYEALVGSGIPHTAVWAYATDPKGFPESARLVKRDSLSYLSALARAEFWVDNQGFPRHVTKRSGTTYLQTWHGTPLKKMGFDEPAIRRRDEEGQQVFQAMIDRWDHLVVPNDFFEEVFVPAHRYKGGLLRTGLPRNDRLFRDNNPEAIAKLKRSLDIPEDRTVVLYAPTFREQDRNRRGPIRLALELGPLDVELSKEIYLLVRPHYLNWLQIPGRYAHFVRDVADVQDVSDLMLVAEVLITDYSSIMFDYANLERPMVFYAYDYEDYANDRRGTYFNLLERAPGPIARTTPEVIDILRELPAHTEAHADKAAEFRKAFCSFEDGTASERVVAAIFGTGSSS